MIEVILLISVAANVVMIALLYLQQRDATAMAERLATRALAAEKVWNPDKELDTTPSEPYTEPTDLEEFQQERERHKQIVKLFQGGPIPSGD